MSEGGGPPGGRPLAVLLRHGETDWSATGRHTGRTDVALTAAGEAQARALRARVAGLRFSAVWCSPLIRAERTAQLAGLTPVDLDADLMEWDYGEMEGRTTDEIRQEYPGWTVWGGPWPGGETIDEVAARADRVVARLRGTTGGDSAGPTVVALVAHGHILRVVAARWLGAPPQAGRWLALETGTFSELGWEHETAVIQRWNA
jgi:broad specificity phosphatase PhoE